MNTDMQSAPFFPKIAEGSQSVQGYWIQTTDNKKLRIAHWKSDGKSRGTILVFQGRTENIEKYGRTSQFFVERGYDVLAIDFRGQGLSDRYTDDRMLGHVESFLDYQKDVEAMKTAAIQMELPKPWILFGHSLGAGIGLRALSEGLEVSCCVFSAPLWGIKLTKIQRLAAWPIGFLSRILNFEHSYIFGTSGVSYALTTPFEDNRLTNDKNMYQYFQSISRNLVDHQTGGPSWGWFYEALKEMRRLKKLPSAEIPCLVFCGDEDSIVDLSSVKARMKSWNTGTLNVLSGARHDVFHETEERRQLIFEEVESFIRGSI